MPRSSDAFQFASYAFARKYASQAHNIRNRVEYAFPGAVRPPLATALVRVLEDDDFAEAAGQAARKFAIRHLDSSVHMDALERLYDEIAAPRRKEPSEGLDVLRQ
jgi:hypothetical protein